MLCVCPPAPHFPTVAGASRLRRCRLFSLETVATAGAQIPGTLHQAAASRGGMRRGGGSPRLRPPHPGCVWGVWASGGAGGACHPPPSTVSGCPPRFGVRWPGAGSGRVKGLEGAVPPPSPLCVSPPPHKSPTNRLLEMAKCGAGGTAAPGTAASCAPLSPPLRETPCVTPPRSPPASPCPPPPRPLGVLCWSPPGCGGSSPGLGPPHIPPSPTLGAKLDPSGGAEWGGQGGSGRVLVGGAEISDGKSRAAGLWGMKGCGSSVGRRGGGSPQPHCRGEVVCRGVSSPTPRPPFPPPSPPPALFTPTHHHQECRKPGGSPSVMFFSHRICGEGVRGGGGVRQCLARPDTPGMGSGIPGGGGL